MASAEKAATPQNDPDRGRVLLVDDEPELRRTFRRALSRAGFEVVDAANGRLALDLLGQHAIEAVVSDVRMPDMNGLELLRHLSIIAPSLPVVLMSGSCTLGNAVALHEHGAFAFLEKPVQLDMLRRATAAAVEAHRERCLDERTYVRDSGVRRAARRSEP